MLRELFQHQVKLIERCEVTHVSKIADGMSIGGQVTKWKMVWRDRMWYASAKLFTFGFAVWAMMVWLWSLIS